MTQKKDKIHEEKNVVKHESAGGFVFFQSPDEGLLVALLKKKDDDYYMPKGHLQGNETPEEAATREVVEELCLQTTPRLLCKVCITKYNFTLPNDERKHQKIVHVYVFDVSEKLKLAPLEIENFEIARWVNINEGMNILAFDEKSLQKAVDKYGRVKK